MSIEMNNFKFYNKDEITYYFAKYALKDTWSIINYL